jgi:hypothetical protein
MDSSVARALFKFRRCATAHGDVVNKTQSSSCRIGQSSSDSISRCVSLDFSFDGLFTEIWGTAVMYTCWEYSIYVSFPVYWLFFYMKTSSWGSASAVCNTARAEDGE